jgi:hypothetical protein
MNYKYTNLTSLLNAQEMCTGSSKRNFLAQLRIPIRVCRKNIQPIDTVHTEHRNVNPWALPGCIESRVQKMKATPMHQLNIIIQWTGSIEEELKISLPGFGSTCASADRLLEQKVKHTQNIHNHRIPLGGQTVAHWKQFATQSGTITDSL